MPAVALATAGTGGLARSASGPSTFGARTYAASIGVVGHTAGPIVTAKKALPGVLLQSILHFAYPDHLENPNSTGRLELFADCGPTDDEGNLRGGFAGRHKLTDGEVDLAIRDHCLESIFQLFDDDSRDKTEHFDEKMCIGDARLKATGKKRPRSTVEPVVRMLHRVAMMHRCTQDEVRQILRGLPAPHDRRTGETLPGCEGRLDFEAVRKAIHASQRRRLLSLKHRAEGGKPVEPPKERLPRVPFQSVPTMHLQKITQKKKLANQEIEVVHNKRLHKYATLIAPIEQQGLAGPLRANVAMVRPPGDLDDRWDRYCSLRRTGRSSYVGARNDPRAGVANCYCDGGLGDKYPGASHLGSACISGSSASVQLAS